MKLTALVCKNCGARLEPKDAAGRVIRCRYCETAFVLACEDEGEVADLLRSGGLLLDTCKFDEAYTAYAKAADLDGKEPEAYFGMALASFHVQYLKDEVNNRLQPICHEISEKVFSKDKNFLRALELATDEQRAEYGKRGREIDEIREEFFNLDKNRLDYDCFICVKVSEESGARTEDCERANDIYYHLKDEGYKPFFSERENKGREGSAYEALILYALYRSECMLIVCSNESYLQTKWMKNEYVRFSKMLEGGEKERDALTFVFADKPVEKLPSGKKLQGIDITRPDAYARIDGFVERHTPEAKKRREAEAERRRAEEAARDRELADLKEQLARMKEERAASASANLSPAQLLAMMRQAEEEEKKQREEEERKKKEEEERRAYLARFTIEDGVLVGYLYKKVENEKVENATIVIPDGITSINEYVFHDCYGVIRFVIPDGVKSIGPNAFTDCRDLKSVVIPESVTLIGAYAFHECRKLTDVVIPNGVIEIGGGAFEGCEGLTGELKIPDSVTSIGDCAFAGCSGLVSVVIPDGVTSIGYNAFADCSGLVSVVIPNDVTSIGNYAFAGCSGLTSVVIPSSVEVIGYYAFARCSGLTSVVIPESVTSIGDNAFAGCSGLKKVTMPKWFEKYIEEIFGKNYKNIKIKFTR